MKKKILIILGIILLAVALTGVAQAYQIPDEYRPENLGFKGDYTQTAERPVTTIVILQTIAGALLYFAAPLAVILIAISAFSMIIGGAESEKLEQSKKHLTWTIIGLLVIILSYSIVRIIITFVSQSADVAK